MESVFSLSVEEFASTRKEEFVGALASAHASSGFEHLRRQQTEAWNEEYELLRAFCDGLTNQLPKSRTWGLVVEYNIPRRQKRPDVVLLADSIVFVIEFKFFAETFTKAAEWQVLDYCLDLRDFHRESAGRTIIPVLVATAATDYPRTRECAAARESPLPVQKLTKADLLSRVLELYFELHDSSEAGIDRQAWCSSAYKPVLSIIEAAENIFANHSVREIAHATSDNLTSTTDRIVRIIKDAQREKRRVVCFVTGVPGAGKTLTGLSSVHDPTLRQEGRPAGVFLSGNGPLVRIVREALTRNAHGQGIYSSKAEAKRNVTTFVQNVHSFLEEYGVKNTSLPPFENVIVFDEAQRAWDANHLKKKKNIDASEAELVFRIMERCDDWCVVVALIGGGQEIHDGEGGLQEWGEALRRRIEPWTIMVSPEMFEEQSPSLSRNKLLHEHLELPHLRVIEEPLLHLAVSVRNLRSKKVSEWVDHLIEREIERARNLISKESNSKLYVTRSLAAARRWLIERAHGDRRFGLLTSSGNLRARAYGLEVSSDFRAGYAFDEWFLALPNDVRSSFQLEVAATEFECQGLELDFVGVFWGEDLCIDHNGDWLFRQFRGSSWKTVKNNQTKQNMLNKYRVLLTRAREGMIICVPPGSDTDATRSPEFLDATFGFLVASGAKVLDEDIDA